jgi:nucleotide-binding universal stress UspA family protein
VLTELYTAAGMALKSIIAIYSGIESQRSLLNYTDGLVGGLGVGGSCLLVMPNPDDDISKVALAGVDTVTGYKKYNQGMEEYFREKHQQASTIFKSIKSDRIKLINETGNPKEIVSYFGKFHDIVIVSINIEKDLDYSGVINSAIFDTGRPVIIYPDNYEYRGLKNIIVGWDGSARAAKSVKSAIDIMKKAENVVVLTVDESQKDTSSVKELITYLASHDVKASHKNVSKIGRCVGDELINEARRQNADMIVMGAYTHNKLQQIVFGGATKFILGNTEVPVFMEH